MKARAAWGLSLLILLCAWSHSADQVAELPAMGQERFMPTAAGRAAVVEVKSEATVTGDQIQLGQVVRWSAADAQQMDLAADLVVARFGPSQNTLTIDLASLKQTLSGAGINLGTIDFCGAIECKATRNDPPVENGPVGRLLALQQLMPATQPVADAADARPPSRSLREVLTAELADRLGVAAEVLQIRFNGDDDKLVNLSEPAFEFTVKPTRIRKLGDMTWQVTLTAAGKSQEVTVSGYARMWQNQLQTSRPLAYKQPIRDEDVAEKRVLVDRLTEDPMLTREQALGQQAGRDMGPNTVLTGRMIEAVTLVRPGQLVTVLLETGHVQVRWVAEARESGTYGQTVRVRKPGTREEFSVVLTGPQQGRLVSDSDAGNVAMAGG